MEQEYLDKIRSLMEEANNEIKTTDIKGKDYAEVSQRIKAFRKVHPLGTISTDIVSIENGVVTMKATIKSGDGVILATGYAYEKEGSTFINKTSYLENCETSAVGRALGFCGFGVDNQIASAEEVQNAQANQSNQELATDEQIKLLYENGSPAWVEEVEKKYNINSLKELTREQANGFIKKMNERKNNGTN